ncbi:Predicted dehydrogenase [Verrucomicrobium sp. GAS474]|uniref:Gfo/Idh/MocA family protein n=1 Tax=Verrucomicrobium sp. GAS474 TaxID=1882831 RepID=UPI000879F407|nr:Gfo/Idh/MocA family oxidoreductase [Verrucomicrobium sp. GAS474]SDT94114.1 Predicted dehydrogenase [Verrucomicrobium sp. GAS474]
MPKRLSLPFRIGIIGCGNISNNYFQHLRQFPDFIRIVACADLDLARARAKAAEHGIARGCTTGELLADPGIDLVLNLTLPATHAAVNLAILKAGKHAYCEKPFSLTYQEGLCIVREAGKRKLRLGCAPDTVLGGGIQTCRKLIDDGAIGRPFAATANLLSPGHELWHPSPEFYYKAGGGPIFDMGPYYLTALVTMLGPVKEVQSSAKKTFKERVITSQPLAGKKIKVDVPTHLTGIVEFAKGATATLTMSFDVHGHHMPLLEIYGTEGTLQCPDPNTFDGEVLLLRKGRTEWESIPLTHSGEVGRGIGLADMADAIHRGRPHRADGGMGLHVVEAMEAFHTSARLGKKIVLKSTCRQPQALPAGLKAGQLH